MPRGDVRICARTATDNGTEWRTVTDFPGQDEWGVYLSDVVSVDGIDWSEPERLPDAHNAGLLV